jgi:hypothetical protein
MWTVKQWRTVKINPEYVNDLIRIYEENKEELRRRGVTTFNGFVNHILWHVIESDRVLRERAPYMSFVGFTDSGLAIKDERIGRIVEVRIVPGGDMFCDLDQRNDCVHVGFAYAIPEVYMAMLARGKRPPKVWE